MKKTQWLGSDWQPKAVASRKKKRPGTTLFRVSKVRRRSNGALAPCRSTLERAGAGVCDRGCRVMHPAPRPHPTSRQHDRTPGKRDTAPAAPCAGLPTPSKGNMRNLRAQPDIDDSPAPELPTIELLDSPIRQLYPPDWRSQSKLVPSRLRRWKSRKLYRVDLIEIVLLRLCLGQVISLDIIDPGPLDARSVPDLLLVEEGALLFHEVQKLKLTAYLVDT
ncbi:UNVERIFIED_CONTAM: hypothetical protein K2H54_047398 [Gekko kuhli]